MLHVLGDLQDDGCSRAQGRFFERHRSELLVGVGALQPRDDEPYITANPWSGGLRMKPEVFNNDSFERVVFVEKFTSKVMDSSCAAITNLNGHCWCRRSGRDWGRRVGEGEASSSDGLRFKGFESDGRSCTTDLRRRGCLYSVGRWKCSAGFPGNHGTERGRWNGGAN